MSSHLTPVEKHGDLWIKRDDLFSVGGVSGGKVRTCWALAAGATGLVSAGSRGSPQVNIVAHIAAVLGIPCRVHVPSGALNAEVEAARSVGAQVIQHAPGYNNVLSARAREDAEVLGWTLIPFGMECDEAVKQTARQVANLPEGIKRIVVPVGSAMSLAGILKGLDDAGRSIPVLGVRVGADPTKRLNKYAPPDWRDRITIVKSELKYAALAPYPMPEGFPKLDPIYEAKCIPELRPGDLMWAVGISQTHESMTAPKPKPKKDAEPTPVRLRFSAAWGSHRVNCTPEGIVANCGGACCKKPGFWPPRASGQPDGSCIHLGDKGCTLSDADKPVTCHLYPMKINPRGTVILHHRIPMPPKHDPCGANYGNGPTVIEAVGDSLKHLFGEEKGAEIIAQVLSGKDAEVDVPPAVLASVEREEQWALDDVIPEPRSQFE